jgi:CheY-like chemotaxis protein
VACIAIIDDDLAMDLLSDGLRFRGHEAYRIDSADQALLEMDRITCADLVILDIIMAWPEQRECKGLTGAHTAGMEILQEIRKRNKNLPIIIYSAIQDAVVTSAISDDPAASFISKWGSPSLKELHHKINCALSIPDIPIKPQPFIVHGHNETVKLALKNYLQNTLGLPEPIILHEKPDMGRSIIEKFEDYAAISSLVFVLLTPDDLVANVNEFNDPKRRARQNVIFEMGYFLGVLGRKSGRVLLLYHPPLELPSDLSGVVYIDISQGVEAAGEKIRREVHNVRD